MTGGDRCISEQVYKFGLNLFKVAKCQVNRL